MSNKITTEQNTMTKQEKSPVGRLEGKTALVTGASRGIGRAIAIELAREGAKVAINYSSSDAKAKEVAEEIKKLGGTAILCKADIGNSKGVRAMVEKVAQEFTHLKVAMGQANYSASKGGIIAFTRTAAESRVLGRGQPSSEKKPRFCARTTSTGQGAIRTTFSAVLP